MTASDPARLLRALQDLRIGFEIVTERIAKATRLNPRDLGVLDVLHAEGPATPRRLATRTGIHPATLTAILARLQREGRVTRHSNPIDARSALIAISDDTVIELTRLYADINASLLDSFAALPTSDRTRIIGFLTDLTTTIHTVSVDQAGDPGHVTNARRPVPREKKHVQK